jgi:hypothetical protein
MKRIKIDSGENNSLFAEGSAAEERKINSQSIISFFPLKMLNLKLLDLVTNLVIE